MLAQIREELRLMENESFKKFESATNATISIQLNICVFEVNKKWDI